MTTTHPATITTTDPNTLRTITWNVDYCAPVGPNTKAEAERNGHPWTHSLGLSRPKGRCLYTAWAAIDADGNITQVSRPINLH